MVGIKVAMMLNFYVILTDDMCHLAPYAHNMVAKGRHDTELTRYFSELKMAVDFLHFKVG